MEVKTKNTLLYSFSFFNVHNSTCRTPTGSEESVRHIEGCSKSENKMVYAKSLIMSIEVSQQSSISSFLGPRGRKIACEYTMEIKTFLRHPLLQNEEPSHLVFFIYL